MILNQSLSYNRKELDIVVIVIDIDIALLCTKLIVLSIASTSFKK